MSENEDLDPALLRHLRDVPPASDAVREAHISAALDEISPSRTSSGRRTRVLGGVAAAVMLTLGGVTIAQRQNENERGPLTGTVTTTVPKGGADCKEELPDAGKDTTERQETEHNGTRYALLFRDDAIDVYRAVEPCDLVGTLSYGDAMVERDKESSLPNPTHRCSYSTELVARFKDAADGDPYDLVVVQTDDGLSVEFDDDCVSSIDTISLP